MLTFNLMFQGRIKTVDTTIAGLAEPHQRDGAPWGQALDVQGWPRAMARLQPDTTTDCDNDGTAQYDHTCTSRVSI